MQNEPEMSCCFIRYAIIIHFVIPTGESPTAGRTEWRNPFIVLHGRDPSTTLPWVASVGMTN